LSAIVLCIWLHNAWRLPTAQPQHTRHNVAVSAAAHKHRWCACFVQCWLCATVCVLVSTSKHRHPALRGTGGCTSAAPQLVHLPEGRLPSCSAASCSGVRWHSLLQSRQHRCRRPGLPALRVRCCALVELSAYLLCPGRPLRAVPVLRRLRQAWTRWRRGCAALTAAPAYAHTPTAAKTLPVGESKAAEN